MIYRNTILPVWIAFIIITAPCFGNDLKLRLNPEEQSWLNENHTVRVRVGNAPPFMLTEGKIQGIAIDYLTYIFSHNGIKFQYVNESEVTWPQALKYIERHDVVDMLPTAKITEERKKRMIFTNEYIFAPWVIFTRSDADFISSIADLKGKTVSVEEGFVIHEKLMQEYPGINFKIISAKLKNYTEIPVKDLSTGLVDAYIGNLLSTTYIIQSRGYTNIKVATPAPFDNHNQAMAIRNDWPELAGIINKTLSAMTQDEHAAIRNKWLTIRYEYGISKTDLLKWLLSIAGIASLFMGFVLTWNKRLKTEVAFRKRMEQDLLKSENKLRATFDATPFPMAVADLQDENIIFWSRSALALFGHTAPTTSAWYQMAYPDPDYRNEAVGRWKTFLETARESGQPVNAGEYRITCRDGSERICELYATILPDNLLVTFNNVTERKQAENALVESETRLRTLVQTIPDMIWLKNPDGVYLDCNAMFEHFFGSPKKDIIGKTDYDFVDRELADFFRENDRKAVAAGKASANEEWLTFADDGYRGLFETIKTPMRNANGKLIGVLGIAHDITGRRRAEQDYQMIFREMLDGFALHEIICDGSGNPTDYRFLDVNPAFERMTGLTAEGIVGKTVLEIFPGTEFKWIRTYGKVALTGAPAFFENYSAELKKHFEVTAFQPAPNQFACIFSDITDRKNAKEEKARLDLQLQQAQKMEAIGSLAGGIAHDLNNILFPISGLSEMLLDDIAPDTPAHENIGQILKSAKRGSELVKQILAFSRQSNPQKLPIRIQSVLKEVLQLSRAAIPMNIEITSHIDTGCGMISADPTQVHQIAMNLITNAYHAVEPTGGKIHVGLEETILEKDDLSDAAMKPGKYACITISDTGTGIDRALIDKIFVPYFTTKEQGKGTGLGLSVVHGIVKQNNGDIRVCSAVGKGATFTVYLPLPAAAAVIKASPAAERHPTGCERILLVDDEEPILRLEQLLLERLGYQVTTRTRSPDALDAFRANPQEFDIVISDRGMPDMTGEQLAGELISIRPEIPIILCSGFSNETDEKRARAMGIKGFLMKPVAAGNLAATVRKVLDEAEATG